MKKYWKQYKVDSSNRNGNEYMSFDEIDTYFDSAISYKVLKSIRELAKNEEIHLVFTDGSSSKVTKLKDGYPRWTLA